MLRLLDLPRDLILHLLMHHFTVQEVIQFRTLCHELYDLVQYCLSRRRSLKLFFSFSEVQAYTQLLYEHNLEPDPVLRLHPRGPSSDELILDQHQFLNPVVDLLVDRLFPNVTHLIIFFGYSIFSLKSQHEAKRSSNLIQHNVTYMIRRMRARLTSLSLFGTNIRGTNGVWASRGLLREINQMPNLRRLDLCVKHLYLYSKYRDEIDRDEINQHKPTQPFLTLDSKVLKKLKHINVLFDAEQNGPNFCEHSFRHLGPNLTHLAMHQLYSGNMAYCNYVPVPLWHRLLIGRTCALAASSITRLKLTQHLSSLLPKVLPRFAGLESLDLVNSTFSKTESGMSILELFGLLAQFCPQLTDLKLSKFKLGLVREAEQNDVELPQLERITKLVLTYVHPRRHDCGDLYDIKPEGSSIPFGQFFRAFAYILPNLKRLHLKTKPGYFSYSDDDRIVTLSLMPRLCAFSIGQYYGTQFSCHQLLSAQYRERYIRECGERWDKLEKLWVTYFKDLKGYWWKEKF